MPRRIVALGAGFALLLIGSTASTAFARDTLIHDGQGGSQGSLTRLADASGSTLVRTTDSQTGYNGFLPNAAALAQYGCVVLPLNTEAIGARIAALKTYAEGGGTVVLISEYHTFSGGQPRLVLNDVAINMGSTMSLNPVTTDFAPSVTTDLGSHALMNGVASIGYNATSTVDLGARGTALARTSAGQPFIGVEQLGSGRLVMMGDSNVVVDNPDYYTGYGNGSFVHNLCGDTSPPDIVISNPVPDARYRQGQANVKAFFGCTDVDDRLVPFYSDILTCVGSFAYGAVIDTSVAGSKVFTVNASDKAFNPATKSVNYIVDGTAPQPYITVPATAPPYVRQGSYPAEFGCINTDDDPVPPTVTASTAPLGGLIKTSATGVETFTITCTDSVGNTASLSRDYTVIDESPPVITITTPLNGARYRLNQAVTALFGCTDADGPSDLTPPGFCTGPVANGGPLPTGTANAPGTTTSFTVSAADQAGNPATKTTTYVVDASPPSIDIVKPAANAKYNKGAQLLADYGCTDPDTNLPTFEDVKSCVGPTAKGDTIDTSTAGTRSFKVDAQDQAGNTATKTNTYTILGTSPPTVTIASPVDGAQFKLGAAIPFSYSCADPDGPQDIRSCTRVGGSGPLDSSKAGTFEVTARVEDYADNVRTKTHKYTVLAAGVAPGASAAPTKTASAKVCKSRRKFTIRVKKKKGVRIVSATVFVNGKKVKTKKGKRFTSVVTLTGLKKGRYTVVIKAKLSDGRTVTDRRKFKTCTPKGK